MRTNPEPTDESLRALLQGARPASGLPPRFQESVWRRIDRAKVAPARQLTRSWADLLIERLLQPRFALAGVAALLIVGGLTGLANGNTTARQLAQERYLSAVAPNSFR